MKTKLLSFLLLLTFLFSCLGAAAQADELKTLHINNISTFQNSSNYSAFKWYNSSSNRALLTLFIAFDAMNAGFDVDLSCDSYVGRDESGDILSVGLKCGSTYYIFMYAPELNICQYIDTEISGSYSARYIMEQAANRTVYTNKGDDLIEMLDFIRELIGL